MSLPVSKNLSMNKLPLAWLLECWYLFCSSFSRITIGTELTPILIEFICDPLYGLINNYQSNDILVNCREKATNLYAMLLRFKGHSLTKEEYDDLLKSFNEVRTAIKVEIDKADVYIITPQIQELS